MEIFPMLLYAEMELSEILNPWIDQLQTSLNPYLQFVNQASSSIAELEGQVSELLESQLKAQVEKAAAIAKVAELSDAVHLAQAKVQAQLAAQVLPQNTPEVKAPRQTESDPSELVSQIATLKTSLADANRKAAEYLEAAAQAKAMLAEQSEPIPNPLHESTRPRRERNHAPAKMPAFPERHVLLVDDAEINRVLMSHYFKGLPVKLEFAVSVAAALGKCKERKFDLIVIDDELQDLENPELHATSAQVVGLSNHANSQSASTPFGRVLSRGQERAAFIEQLKSFLWDAERTA